VITPSWSYVIVAPIAIVAMIVRRIMGFRASKARSGSDLEPDSDAPLTEPDSDAPRTEAELYFRTLKDGLGRIDWRVFFRVALVAFSFLAVVTTFLSYSMWLPAQRVQPVHAAPYTAYILASDDQGIELLIDKTRLVKTLPTNSGAKIQLCSLGSDRINIPGFPVPLRRALKLTPESAIEIAGNEQSYPACPK
jgi:hypothetical protein